MKATAYRQQRLLGSAEQEYRAASKYAPNDLQLQLALADTLYDMRRYQESIDALNQALSLSPDDPLIYAQMAHAYAQLHDRDETLRYVAAAEQQGRRSVGHPARYRRRVADARRQEGRDGPLRPRASTLPMPTASMPVWRSRG